MCHYGFIPLALVNPVRALKNRSVAPLINWLNFGSASTAYNLKRNLSRLDYVLEKFGITRKQAGVTRHGLQHGNLNDYYESLSGCPSPARGG